MTPEERQGAGQEILDLFHKRDEFELRLNLVMASAIPPRLKNYRIKLITREIVALKNQINFRVVALNFDHGDPTAKAHLERWAAEGNEEAKALLARLG